MIFSRRATLNYANLHGSFQLPTASSLFAQFPAFRRRVGHAGKKCVRWAIAACLVAGVLPAPADAQTAVGATSSVLTATVTIATAGTLSSINVLTQGAANKDFQYASGGTCAVGTPYAANATCTVEYTFAPTRPGQRLGGIVLMGASAPLGQTPITGTGTGPLAEFPGSTALSAAGSGFSEPDDVAVDGSGNVFVADSLHDAVKEIEAGTGGNAAGVVSSSSTVVTVGSGISYPVGVAVDGSGNVFVTDTIHSAVKEIEAGTGGNAAGVVSSSSTMVTVGSGFSYPEVVAVDGGGNVFVADTDNSAVKEIEAGTGGNAAGVVSSSSTVVTVGRRFNGPEGVAVDGSGNVFVADAGSNAVYEIEAGTGGNAAGVVSSSSTVVTVGSGFSYPDDVAVDGSGNVFVADVDHNAVKEIESGTGGNAAGVVSSSSTVVTVGSGFSYPEGVAVDGSGHIFVADFSNNAVKEIDLTAPPALSFASTAVGNTSSDSPKSVTVQNAGYGTGSSSDATDGNLSFSAVALGADPDFTLGSGTCGTSSALAWGTNCTVTASFAPVQPGSLSSTITLTDDTNNASAVSQNISLSGTATAATGATAQTITFPQPSSPTLPGTSVTLTATASSGLPVLYSVISGPGTVSGSTLTYTGTGTVVVEADQCGNNTYAPATAVQRSVAVQISDTVGSSSSTLTATVTIATAGTLSSINVLTQGAANKDFQYAGGGTCAVGTPYAANATCTVEYTFAPTRPGQRLGGIVLMGASAPLGQTPITGMGMGPLAEFPGSTAVSAVGGGFSGPSGVAVDGSGNVFVADTNNNAVKEIEAGTGGNAAGAVSSSSTVVTVGSGFAGPIVVAVDGSGNVFVADTDITVVKEIEAGTGGNAAGVVSSSSTVVAIGNGFNTPTGVAVDGSGNVFVADAGNNAVKEIEAGTGGNAAGVVSSSSTVVTVGSGFAAPTGVAVDGSGNVFVADYVNSAVYEIEAGTGGNAAGVVSSSSTVVTVGSGFSEPIGVAVDGSGNVFVADSNNNAVKEIEAGTGGNAAGVVSSGSTVVTVGSGFSYPEGVAVDGSGHVFVADTLNSAVKEIDLTAPPALSFASTAVGNTSSDSPKSVTVQNAGNADLSITVAPTGTNPSVAANFSLAGTSTCPSISTSGPAGSLPQSGLCTYAFNFTPTMAGSISGSAVLTDNTLSGLPQNIPLSGTGTAGTPVVAVISSGAYANTTTTLTAKVTFGGVAPTGAVTFSIDSGAATSAATCTSSGSPETCTLRDCA